MNKNKVATSIVVMIITFSIIFSASYSYFAAQGIGTGLENQATITVGELKLVYADGTDSFSTTGEFEPGDFMIK